MQSEFNDRSLSLGGESSEDRGSGFMPLQPPVYISLWRIRTEGVPRLTATLVRSVAPRLSIKTKKGKGLKTPRMMLPNLLG